jgi:hypothetical protein
MAQIAIANQLATDLNIDKIIRKLEYELIGFSVEYLSGTLYDCIQSGKELSFDCFVSSLATNWVNNLENFWLNYTPFGIIINHIGILNYNYKCVVGKDQTLSCKDSQVSHLSSCYNKDEIPQDYSFIAFNSIDWKGIFGRNCTLNQKDTG